MKDCFRAKSVLVHKNNFEQLVVNYFLKIIRVILIMDGKVKHDKPKNATQIRIWLLYGKNKHKKQEGKIQVKE